MVPENRGVRAGRQARPDGGRLEVPPVPRALGVLRGFRTLRGRDDGPGIVHRRRNGTANGGTQKRRRHGDVHLRTGRHPRFRLGGRPELRRRARDIFSRARSNPGRTGTDRDAPRPADRRGCAHRRRHHAPHAAGPPAAGRAPYACRESGGEGLRTLVRALPVRDVDGRRSSRGRRRRRRDGIPDLHHRRYEPLFEPPAPGSRYFCRNRS